MGETACEFGRDLLFEFIAESVESLEYINQNLLDLEKDPGSKDIIDGIFRYVHTIKGTSGFFGLDNVNKLSHSMETLLDRLRKGEKKVTPELLDVIFKGCDVLSSLIEELNLKLDDDMNADLNDKNDKLDEVLTELENAIKDEGDEGKGNMSPGEKGMEYNITPEMIEEFQEEAHEHIESSYKCLNTISDSRDDKTSIDELFRQIHSIKGTSDYLLLRQITELSHSIEDILDIVRRKESPYIDDDLLDILFSAIDILKTMIDNPEKNIDYADALKTLTGYKQALKTGSIDILKTISDDPEKSGDCADELKALTGDEQTPKTGNDSGRITSNKNASNTLNIFQDSTGQHLSVLRECLSRIDNKAWDKDTIDVMGRTVRSLKSAARYIGSEDIEKETEILEEAISSIKAGDPEPSPAIIDIIKDGVGAITKHIDNLVAKENKDADISDNPAKVAQKQDGEKAREKGEGASRDSKTPNSENKKKVERKTMRVSQDILDTFMNLVGELIVARNSLGHVINRLDQISTNGNGSAAKDIRSVFQTIYRISEDMQGNVMEMRMVPINTVFQRFPRMARDLTRKSNKKADIVLQGGETEIDKSIAENLVDPLVHIIRNAIDHGIETPEIRKKQGKNEKGTIILRATRLGNSIIIDIIDDGSGIDTEAVLKKAIERGIVSSEQARGLGKEDIFRFIFAPGFSTAKKITDISGRGVGMDVVLTNIKQLKGNVKITSEYGQGTHLQIEVPLTLALIDALLVEVGEDIFAMPVECISETVKVKKDDVRTMMAHKYIVLREDVVNIATLPELLHVDAAEGIANYTEDNTVVIINIDNKRLGIIVDSVKRKEEVIIKPLVGCLSNIPGISGATILGDGRPVLILEPGQLISVAMSKEINADLDNPDHLAGMQ